MALRLDHCPAGARTAKGEGGYDMTGMFKRLLSLAAALLLLVCTTLTASALDDTYRFDDFGFSVKVSKNYYVVTRDTPADDPVFAALKLNYNDTMSTFRAAGIYLRAYDPDGVFQLSLTVASDEKSRSVNNYSELSDAERKGIIDVLLAQPTVTAAYEVKHGGNIFIDSSRETTIGDDPLYINQCNTIINGLQIDLSLQKSKEVILPAEAKVLTAIASSMEFDTIVSAHSGPLFDWWRVLLWGLLLAALTVASSMAYKHRNNVRRRRLEEWRRQRVEAEASAAEAQAADTPEEAAVDGEPLTFDEALGYRDADRFSSRAATDLDTFDISVREKNPAGGISYFEDGGKSIDDRASDYFESYFREQTPRRSGISRLMSKIGAYIGIAFRHVGYFFKNLFRGVTGKNKKPS